ncbi:hypothetical protein HYPSUDRAFT_441487 [Hypholoma sublateritium FD-334 SS-4]|uniref:Uncharacterized protein n=1 Tax=Hypholoma sublateritium (strain FD-334 SS-4) TaxID=945553 RepID=A0A0D2MMR2_HYPSF|nr:hypothetical protein HYPSUDRAFT_441487 [Hypholoma sublateritium FD-334 SS-4]
MGDDSLDADAISDRPPLLKRRYRTRKQRADVFIFYQPKGEGVTRSNGKRKMGDREEDEPDSRARKTGKSAPFVCNVIF